MNTETNTSCAVSSPPTGWSNWQRLLSNCRTQCPARNFQCSVFRFPHLLEDIADVRIGAKLPKLGTASERGKPAVLLTVTKQPATSTLELTDKLETSLKDLQKNLPPDVKVSTDIFRQSRFIESSIGNVQKSLFEGGIFVVIVLFLFLANVRTTVISLVTLPLSLIASLLALHYMGFTINTMSLGGMLSPSVRWWTTPLSMWRTCTNACGKTE